MTCGAAFRGFAGAYGSLHNCDPPRENRDKGDSTLTTRKHNTLSVSNVTDKLCAYLINITMQDTLALFRDI